MELLRLATAGSVDDGKSTLIGRLLYDAKGIFEDQLESIRRTSEQRGNPETDLALLTDGLRAEREQGITIDVAYRYFATPKRKFIIADTPGHTEYTRNMVTGASTAHVSLDPDRRPQGGDRADPPPRLPLLDAGRPPHGRLREQDGPDRLGPRPVRADPVGLHGVRGPAERPRHRVHPHLGAERRQRRAALRGHVVVPGAAAADASRVGLHRLGRELHRPALPGAVRDPEPDPGQSRLPGLRGDGGVRRAAARATRCWCCRPGRRRRSSRSSRPTARCARPSRPWPSWSRSKTTSRSRGATCCAGPTTGPPTRTTSRRRCAGWTSVRRWPSGVPTC